MITDDQLYSLATFFGTASMLLIVLYHFLEVNAKDESGKSDTLNAERRADAGVTVPPVVPAKAR